MIRKLRTSLSNRKPDRRKRDHAASLFSLAAELLEPRMLLTGVPTLIDIVAGAGASYPMAFTNVNNTLFFVANDGTHGRELWKSNASTIGTTLVKDIRPGSVGSAPQQLVNVNGTLFFSADDGATGRELWKRKGTGGGTTLVVNINPGAASSTPTGLTAAGVNLFFAANNLTNGNELWTLTNPTSAGALSTEAPSPFMENITDPIGGVGTLWESYSVTSATWISGTTEDHSLVRIGAEPTTTSSDNMAVHFRLGRSQFRFGHFSRRGLPKSAIAANGNSDSFATPDGNLAEANERTAVGSGLRRPVNSDIKRRPTVG